MMGFAGGSTPPTQQRFFAKFIPYHWKIYSNGKFTATTSLIWRLRRRGLAVFLRWMLAPEQHRQAPVVVWHYASWINLESMGRSERRQLTNWFERLLMHLLKWHYQPDCRDIDGKSWLRTIREQRRKLPKLIRDNPSLKPLLEDSIRDARDDARFGASDETG